MKKLLSAILCFLLILPCACAEEQARRLTEDEPLYTCLYERSMEMAGIFDTALRSEEYQSLFFSPGEFAETLSLLKAQDFTQPVSAAAVRSDTLFSGELNEEIAKSLGIVDLPEPLDDFVWRAFYLRAASVLTGQMDSATLSLSMTLAFSDAIIQPGEIGGPCFVVLFYGGLYAFLVTFYPTVNGTVLLHAQFIPSGAADRLNLPGE